jgi:proline-specific peptidase
MYDQIKCGESTLFTNHLGDTFLWNLELWVSELDNLKHALGIKSFDLLGQSWGGLLAAYYTVTVQPVGLRKLIICNSVANFKTGEKVSNDLLAALPIDLRETIYRLEKEGKTDTTEWNAAMGDFNNRHSCRLDTLPKELEASMQALAKDSTVMMTLWGMSDFNTTGSRKTLIVLDELKKLTPEVVPGGMLLMNGHFDLTQDEVIQPFFDEPSAKVKWIRFRLSSYSPMLEEAEKFIEALGSFLQN